MSDLVEDIAKLLSSMPAANQVEIIESVASRLGVEKLIGKNNLDRVKLLRECVRLEEEAWQYGNALTEITALSEGHLAKFRIRDFMREDDE